MKHIGLIILIGGAKARAGLAFFMKAFDLVIPNTKIQGPLVVHAPLILHPKLFSRLDFLIGCFSRDDWHCRRAATSIEGKDLGCIIRSSIINLKSGLD